MKKQVKSLLSISLTLFVVLFSSCEKDNISSLKINKTSLSVNVGVVDTVKVTVGFTGELTDKIVKWNVADTTILGIVQQLEGGKTVSGSESSLEKLLVVKAKKSGSTKVTLTAGEKSIDCVVTVAMRKFTFAKIIANNYGDSYDVGLNNFELVLYENTMTLTSGGQLSGDGNFVILDFNVPITQNTMAVGEFAASEDFDVNTFIPGFYYDLTDGYYYSLFINTKNKVRSISLVTGGNYVITSSAAGYAINGELELETGEIIQFESDGNPTVADKRDVAEVKPALTHGLLNYYGDFYKTGKSNNLSVYLASASLNFADTATKGDILALEVNIPLTVKDTIPNGTYNFVNFPQNMSALPLADFVAFTLVPPFYDNEYNEYGSWFYGQTKTKKLKTGSITSKKTGTNSYEIVYEFYDRFGAKIYGSFNGDLVYTDKTKSAGVKVAKAPAKLKSGFAIPSKKSYDVVKKLKQRKLSY